MKVKELMELLNYQDPEMDVICYSEDETIAPKNVDY
jgi:hypothetical protein